MLPTSANISSGPFLHVVYFEKDINTNRHNHAAQQPGKAARSLPLEAASQQGVAWDLARAVEEHLCRVLLARRAADVWRSESCVEGAQEESEQQLKLSLGRLVYVRAGCEVLFLIVSFTSACRAWQPPSDTVKCGHTAVAVGFQTFLDISRRPI